MQLDDKFYKKIMNKGKGVFEMLEQYDETREWPLGRKRIDITLSKRTIQRLKLLKAKQGKPISRIIEEAVDNL